MTVLFGHPTGNPNSHNAALAHFEADWLESFCVSWMPTERELGFAQWLPGLAGEAERLARRRFAPLAAAPKIEGRVAEWRRMARRLVLGERRADERISYEANDWLMQTMRVHSARPAVTAVHAYEDCSLQAFEAAKRLGKACLYDMPIGYYPAWERKQAELAARYADWLPRGVHAGRHPRRDQKIREMVLADLVLVPSTFVARTIEPYVDKQTHLCPYGVDTDYWQPQEGKRCERTMRFIFAGACSLRKGIPVLLNAWREAAVVDARLELAGSWQLSDARRADLPAGVSLTGAMSAGQLRTRYQAADVLVFPSFFEGFGLVVLEALACGLPVIATDATAGPDLLDELTGRVVPAGDAEALAEALRWFGANREKLGPMRTAARARALEYGWQRYRSTVRTAVTPFAR